MATECQTLVLPDYDVIVSQINPLALPVSVSKVHGILCGFLSAGLATEAETTLRGLTLGDNNPAHREAIQTLFLLLSISQEQITHCHFDFQLLIPNDESPLDERAIALSEWCEGYIQSLEQCGIDYHDFHDEDTQEAVAHLKGFSLLDYDSIEFTEEDERAFFEIYDYARLAVIQLYEDIRLTKKQDARNTIAH
jgi:uncharacterized protein YgfB (UPF0149 family)